MKKDIIVPLVIAIIFGASGFYGGMKYQQTKSISGFSREFGTRTFGRGQGGNVMMKGQSGTQGSMRMGFRPILGEIISADDKSITVKLTDGSSKIVMLSDKTTINKAESATKDELVKGTKVSVFGQEDADGIVSAQSIQLNPTSMMKLVVTPTK